MSTELGYIIVATRDDGTRWYMATDRDSGGYEYFAREAASAQLYPTSGEAERQVKRRIGDRFLHGASGADYEHPVRRVNVSVEVVRSSPVDYNVDFSFEINAVGVVPKREWKALA